MIEMTGTDELETFQCPRCGQTAQERFWGPCRACREQLVATYRSEETGGDVETSRFEPAMHVVPNHVATKD